MPSEQSTRTVPPSAAAGLLEQQGAAEGDTPSGSRRGRWRAMALPVTAGCVGIAAVALLHVRDPHIEGSYGVCPSYALLGVYCPGCGGMRAVHNLTDGRILDSLHSNLIALPLLIAFALWVVDWAVRSWRGQPMRQLSISWFTMWTLLVALAGYTVLRNTPWGTWLTPV